MTSERNYPKSERFQEFLRRLHSALATASFEEAYEQICAILNEVEDLMTSIPYHPENWQTDGRMYPPQPDSLREVEGHPGVKRFRSRSHNTFIGENGAIEIRTVPPQSEVTLAKKGADGKGVWEP